VSKGKDMTMVPMAELMPMWLSRRGTPAWWPFGAQDMKLEEFREKDALVVRAELPGVDPDKEIEVTVGDGMLRIHAERTQESKREDDASFRSEFSYGALTRTLALPPGAAGKHVKASYHDGILEVRVPVDERTDRTEKVAITRS
jgi:HSP20 family protein